MTVVRPQFSAAEAERPAQVSVDEADELERAEQILIQRCIERAGFQYTIVPRFVDPVPFTFSYVVDDAGWADKHGYGTALRRQAEAKVDPNERYFRSLPPTRQQALATALNGPELTGLTATLPGGQVVQHSDQGCQSEAQRELYGDLQTWYASTKVTENLKAHRFGLVLGDPRFEAALPAWSACMRERGHRFAHQRSRPARTWSNAQQQHRRAQMVA